jgi:CubicO group peptidase (beta-lactamase class C family)
MKIDPDAAGLDATRLERITEHVEARYMGPGKLAGCQVAVQRHGTLGYFRSFGDADRERSVPVVDDTIWRYYSMTKPVTGVALMQLYEQGHFQLNDNIDRFLPEFADLKVSERNEDGTRTLVEPRQKMRVKDALMHTTGIGYGTAPGDTVHVGEPSAGDPTGMFGFLRQKGMTLERMVTLLAEQPLYFHPGERWLYSYSTDICSRLVEVISGQRYDDYLRDNLFGPLGMEDAGFVVPDDKADRFAASYVRKRDKTLGLLEDPTTSGYRRQRSFLSGGGGLVGTTADYLRFAQMLCNGGELDGVRILGRKTVELMAMNHFPPKTPGTHGTLREYATGAWSESSYEGVGFGLTVAVGVDPAVQGTIGSAGEFFWGGAASTIFWIDPAEELVVVFMTQLIPSSTFNFRGQLKSLVYPAIVD